MALPTPGKGTQIMIFMSTTQESFQIGAALFLTDSLDKLPCMGYSCVIIKFNASGGILYNGKRDPKRENSTAGSGKRTA